MALDQGRDVTVYVAVPILAPFMLAVYLYRLALNMAMNVEWLPPPADIPDAP